MVPWPLWDPPKSNSGPTSQSGRTNPVLQVHNQLSPVNYPVLLRRRPGNCRPRLFSTSQQPGVRSKELPRGRI